MSLDVRTAQRIAAPIDTVFEAIVDPEKMAGYFITSGSARMAAGQTVTWSWADHGGVSLDVEVEEVVAPESIVFVWSASGAPRRVRITLRAESNDVTEIAVTEGSFELETESVQRFGEQMQGWANMLACLKAYLEYYQINLRSVPIGSYGGQVENVIDATSAELFRAFTTDWEQWFALPGTASVVAEVGGLYRFVTDGGDGKQYPHHGRFARLVPDEHVELTWVTEATRGVETTLRVELEPDGERTRVRLTHEGFGDAALARRHEAAWPDVLQHLENCLRR